MAEEGRCMTARATGGALSEDIPAPPTVGRSRNYVCLVATAPELPDAHQYYSRGGAEAVASAQA